MSKKTALLWSVVCVIVFSSVALASDLPYVPGELLVQFAPKPDSEQRTLVEKNQILSSLGGATVERNYKIVPGLSLVKLPAGQTVEDALKTFNRTDGILLAAPNHKLKYASTFPNDPCFPQLWGMHNIGQTGGTEDADIDAPKAWDIHTGSGDIIVAVLDSGVDYNHPDLADNMWTDANGSHGYDFGADDADPMDYLSHGTHCAGTIGAVGNNEEGVTGVCWNVKIMAVKISTDYGIPDMGAAIAGIEYAAQMGAEVLNASWGTTSDNPFLKDAIENVDANGVLVVACAHNISSFPDPNNDKTPIYPASYDCNNIIAVLATNHDDSIWSGSHYGAASVDLGAPGSDILSCVPGGSYESWSGTSMAAPHVAGAAALLWSLNPAMTHLQVKDIILNTVDQLSALDGLCVTGGRLNLYNAIVGVGKLAGILTKVDDINDSVLPGDDIIYTISYGNPFTDANDPNYLGDINDVNIIDYLPEEVDFNSASGPNMTYDSDSHTVTWGIGDLDANDPCDSVTLTVMVNQLAEPNGTFTNFCKIETESLYTFVVVDTNVGCWAPDIIYVDVNADGYDTGTGMSWKNAYRDLQDALDTARNCDCNEIWVAAAETSYKPTEPSGWQATFELVDGVAIYGGFAGNETSRSQRNWLSNETILTGDIGTVNVNYVVTASGVGETAIIDGFTIRKGVFSGININGGSPTISHNRITENDNCGIWCQDTETPLITNNWIYNNGYRGIHFENPDAAATVRNNTVVYNTNYGITSSIPPPPNPNFNPNITNCIIWGNTQGQLYTSFPPFNNVTYSCIQGDPVYEGNGNINTDPCFVDDPNDPNNYHLSSDSPCIDAGDPCFTPDPNEKDIDGEPRIIDGNENGIKRVDIGADEFYWSPADYDDDGIVNFIDYAMFANAWQTDDPNISLDDDNDVDINDLDLFCKEWLWQPAWKQPIRVMMMGGSMGGASAFTKVVSPPEQLEPQPQPEPEPEPELQPQPEPELQPQPEPEPQPPLTEEDIQALIKWLEELWLTEEELKEQFSEAEWLEFIETVRETPIY